MNLVRLKLLFMIGNKKQQQFWFKHVLDSALNELGQNMCQFFKVNDIDT